MKLRGNKMLELRHPLLPSFVSFFLSTYKLFSPFILNLTNCSLRFCFNHHQPPTLSISGQLSVIFSMCSKHNSVFVAAKQGKIGSPSQLTFELRKWVKVWGFVGFRYVIFSFLNLVDYHGLGAYWLSFACWKLRRKRREREKRRRGGK